MFELRIAVMFFWGFWLRYNQFALCAAETSKIDRYTANKNLNWIQAFNFSKVNNTFNNSEKIVLGSSNMHSEFMDCADYLQMGHKISGVYRIWPKNIILKGKSVLVFCDMETDGGGWTVLQRRGDFLRPSDYFLKNWVSYKNGFGDIERDFWLGNDNIFALTNQRTYSVRFDLTDAEEEHRYALYDEFYIANEELKYRLTINEFSGTTNDSMKYHNGRKFTTIDQDNDNSSDDNCAKYCQGAWWYNNCSVANLNGLYVKGQTMHHHCRHWSGYKESLYRTEIKIRPKNFRWISI